MNSREVKRRTTVSYTHLDVYKRQIIDCDTGIDDMISFVLTLASKQLDIRGVTTVAGNVSLPHTTYNTVNGLAFMGRSERCV